jgi:transcriptional regulator
VKTVRQSLIDELLRGEWTARELSKVLRRSEKEIYEHLAHINRTLASRNMRLRIIPARCLECDYSFGSRNRFTSPGRCPRCRGEHIENPRFRIPEDRSI